LNLVPPHELVRLTAGCLGGSLLSGARDISRQDIRDDPT
jgi:hypothetical protein